MTFGEKLKSWKRWGTILGAIMPILVQLMTQEVSWPTAIVASVVVILVGLGVLGVEDVTRIKAMAAVDMAELAARNPTCTDPTKPRAS